MKSRTSIAGLFYVAGAYDAILGIVFLLFAFPIYDWFEIPRPNHIGYVQFPAALLIVFGLMFFSIARDPIRNRNLVPYGVLLKVSYCAVVFGHWFTAGLPNLWKPFAFIDVAFGLLFVWAYISVGRSETAASPEPG
jgi:hypothetical protein